nr:hypothetical protein [Bacteroidota bacterium]
MKTLIKSIAALITITLITISLPAQTPPPPNGNQTPVEGGNTPVGGGAAIGSGIAILIALGAGYGAKKVFDFKNRKLEE